MVIIDLKGVGRTYQMGSTSLNVLWNVNLTVEAGEFLAITGPSGSGKSTLMQIMGLLDRPSAGQYFLLGRDVSHLVDDEASVIRSTTIGFVFQMFNLLPRTSALANVMLPMIYSGTKNREERSQELLASVGLENRMTHRASQLSGGQQQR